MAALVSPVQHIFFLTVTFFILFVLTAQQAGQAVVPGRQSLICISGRSPPPPLYCNAAFCFAQSRRVICLLICVYGRAARTVMQYMLSAGSRSLDISLYLSIPSSRRGRLSCRDACVLICVSGRIYIHCTLMQYMFSASPSRAGLPVS